jgi:hypothetical protein
VVRTKGLGPAESPSLSAPRYRGLGFTLDCLALRPLGVEISALGSGHSFSARIAKNWSTRIGSSPVPTLLPVPIYDRSRLVHRARKQIWPGGRTGQECAFARSRGSGR